jgi:hypothetical protein
MMGSQEHSPGNAYVSLSAVRFWDPIPLIAQTASRQTLLVKSEPSFQEDVIREFHTKW